MKAQLTFKEWPRWKLTVAFRAVGSSLETKKLDGILLESLSFDFGIWISNRSYY